MICCFMFVAEIQILFEDQTAQFASDQMQIRWTFNDDFYSFWKLEGEIKDRMKFVWH